jgi:hypothetical protein
MPKTWVLRMERAIRREATVIVGVLVKRVPGIIYVCEALRDGSYRCGFCREPGIQPKKRCQCANCGIRVSDVVRTVDPDVARRIRRTFLEMWQVKQVGSLMASHERLWNMGTR